MSWKPSILFVISFIGCNSQLEPCQVPPDGNMYPCLTLSRLKHDYQHTSFNGAWKPYSLTECYDSVYIYQLADGTASNLYLCHGKAGAQWTISDQICNQTDSHKRAYCQRARHDITYCDGDAWFVEVTEGDYEAGADGGPVVLNVMNASLCNDGMGSSEGDGISGGWVFIIVLFGLFAVYCCIGYIVNGYRNDGKWKEYGDNIPNYAFWRALPRMTIVGCNVSYQWVLGKMGRKQDEEETTPLVVDPKDEL